MELHLYESVVGGSCRLPQKEKDSPLRLNPTYDDNLVWLEV